MDNSNIYQLISSFSPVECREVRRFLASPFFNRRSDLQALFDVLCRETEPEKQHIWAALFPDTTYDDTQMRLLMSYLNKLLEMYLLVEQDRSKTLQHRLQLAVAYRNRGLMDQYARHMRAMEKELERQPLRNAAYHDLLRDYTLETHETTVTQNPTDTESLRLLAYRTDVQYLSKRLRLFCLELAQKNVYQAGAEDPLHRDVIALAERPEWRDLPGISTYLAAYRMLHQPEAHTRYQTFRDMLGAVESNFSNDEMREFYTFCINHCIRRANSGHREMEREVLALYRSALEAGYLFENGLLSRFTYHNIVAAGLRCDELDWVENFIHQYKSTLERKYRDSSLSFNLARLNYARGRYDTVLALLQRANYHDPLFNLAAKTLLLKTYYVLDEYDLLASHLDAMRNYIRRKKVIGYHRTNYLNIIRYAERVLHPGSRQAKEKLRREIETEPVLTEKAWLLSCLE
ncbi:MAG: hypothetical protein H6565_04605 [Lewinellaceae bacterium]|nr:hypothetical protein [Lewinellaceae bacterium]